jgi:hypothetical protein
VSMFIYSRNWSVYEDRVHLPPVEGLEATTALWSLCLEVICRPKNCITKDLKKRDRKRDRRLDGKL